MTRERLPGRIRLARALRSAGPGGVHTLSIREELRIGNPSERVEDLRRRGFEITSTVETRHGCHGARYVMTVDAGDSAAWVTDSDLNAQVGGGESVPIRDTPDPGAAADLSVEMCWSGDFTAAGYDPAEPFERVPYELPPGRWVRRDELEALTAA
jgi:hypothetical protein